MMLFVKAVHTHPDGVIRASKIINYEDPDTIQHSPNFRLLYW